jgi:adenine/guanine phosphoribosyltransferase-like PRPP-binding protein
MKTCNARLVRPLYDQRRDTYLSDAFGDPRELIDTARYFTSGVEFDTIVGRGLSGALVVPMLARALDTYWAIVRKEDGSHSHYDVEGAIGRRWLFVDDFICSGRTRDIVRAKVEAQVWNSVYVGTYCYARPTEGVAGVSRMH